MIYLFSILILTLPTVYELYVERKGEAMKSKRWSMFVRVVIAIVSTWVAAVFKNDNLVMDLLKSAVMAFAIFFLTFDYLFNIIFHKKTRVWYSYLSKSPLDKLWSGWHWMLRMGIRIAVFIAALLFYF